MADDGGARWWHAPLIGGLATVGTFFMSHYGGATHDDIHNLEAKITPLAAKVDQLEVKCAGIDDTTRKFIRDEVAASEARTAAAMKLLRKRKETRGQ
jgi:hypothetical protein